MAIAKDSRIRQIVAAPIEGTVKGFKIDENTSEVSVVMEYTDADGVEHERAFKLSEVEEVAT